MALANGKGPNEHPRGLGGGRGPQLSAHCRLRGVLGGLGLGLGLGLGSGLWVWITATGSGSD
jgi:hypothetical protein